MLLAPFAVPVIRTRLFLKVRFGVVEAKIPDAPKRAPLLVKLSR